MTGGGEASVNISGETSRGEREGGESVRGAGDDGLTEGIAGVFLPLSGRPFPSPNVLPYSLFVDRRLG